MGVGVGAEEAERVTATSESWSKLDVGDGPVYLHVSVFY